MYYINKREIQFLPFNSCNCDENRGCVWCMTILRLKNDQPWGGDLRRLRGDRDKKSVPHCIVHACMNGLFFLATELHRSFSSYITFTTLLQHSFSLYITFTTLLHHFYIICTSLLHHSFSSYVTFILCAICTSPPS